MQMERTGFRGAVGGIKPHSFSELCLKLSTMKGDVRHRVRSFVEGQ